MNKPTIRATLLITIALLPLVYWTVWTVWKVLTGPFGAEVQSMVIGAVIGGVLTGITGYWLGASAQQERPPS